MHPRQGENESGRPARRTRAVVLSLVGGFILGAAATGAAAFLLLPGQMITVKESRLGFDETVAALKEAIERRGWEVQEVRRMDKGLARRGERLNRRVALVKLCHPKYASSVLRTDPEVSCLMPCTIAVWEGDDEKVHLSKMNTGLMGKMFGGNIAEVMGGSAADDEAAMLSGIVR